MNFTSSRLDDTLNGLMIAAVFALVMLANGAIVRYEVREIVAAAVGAMVPLVVQADTAPAVMASAPGATPAASTA